MATRSTKFSPWLVFSICSMGLLPTTAIADEILTSAEVYGMSREVHLQRFQQKKAKPVSMGEQMYPKDLMRTGAESWAKLLFNEGTLIRLDAHDVFGFVPGIRSFELKHGVILSLIYPGNGTTTILTPEANTIALGTALVVRHDTDHKETRVGVLTDKQPVYVTLPNGSERVKLGAGDRVTIREGQMGDVTAFNLDKFYQVCELSQGLAPEQGEAIAAEPTATQETWQLIRAETQAALLSQQPTTLEDDGAELCEPVAALPQEKRRRAPGFTFGLGGGSPTPPRTPIPGGPRVP